MADQNITPTAAVLQALASGRLRTRPVIGEETRQNPLWKSRVADMLNIIDAWTAAHPVMIPVPEGTPTLDARRLAESQRQFDEEMRYKWYDLAQKAALEQARQSASSDSLKDLLGYTPTENERKKMLTKDTFDEARRQYLTYYKQGEGQKNRGYPLRRTLQDVLTDRSFVGRSVAGASAADVVDALVKTYTKKSADAYFQDLLDTYNPNKYTDPIAKRNAQAVQNEVANLYSLYLQAKGNDVSKSQLLDLYSRKKPGTSIIQRILSGLRQTGTPVSPQVLYGRRW